MQTRAIGQNAVLSGIEKFYVLSEDTTLSGQLAIKVTISKTDNVESILFGIGSAMEKLDIVNYSGKFIERDGKLFLAQAAFTKELSGSDLFLFIPVKSLDLTDRFLTVYLVNKDSSFSNKLSISAK